jgi:hypothetical protein
MSDRDQFAQPSIFSGAKSPENITVTIVPGDMDIDLTTVDLVNLRVKFGIDPEAVWTTTIVSQRFDRLVVNHIFDADGVETRNAGRYRVIPELVLKSSGGTRRADPFYFAVMP